MAVAGGPPDAVTVARARRIEARRQPDIAGGGLLRRAAWREGPAQEGRQVARASWGVVAAAGARHAGPRPVAVPPAEVDLKARVVGEAAAGAASGGFP